MTTTFALVRHASHDLLGRVLAGRMAGVRLSPAGRAEAGRLAGRFTGQPIREVHSSPLERARETAAPIAAALDLEVEVAEPLNEIDFGEWTGAAFDALEPDPRWGTWNTARSLATAPSGESMLGAQSRALGHLLDLAPRHADSTVVLVSHQDIIKAVLAHILGLSLDLLHRFEIGPASVSTVVIGSWGGKVLTVNETIPA